MPDNAPDGAAWRGAYAGDHASEGAPEVKPQATAPNPQDGFAVRTREAYREDYAQPGERAPSSPSQASQPSAKPAWDAKAYGLEGNSGEFSTWAGNAFHANGVAPETARKLVTGFNDFVKEATARHEKQAAERQRAEDATFKANDAREEAELKTEWGVEYDAKVRLGRAAVRSAKLSSDDIDMMTHALGHSKTMKLLTHFGTMVR